MSKKRDADREARASDPDLLELWKLMRRLADEQCGPDASFEERSAAMRRVAAAAWPGAFEGDDDGHEREDPKR
ncbi:MAG TPA: hypothetical protein PKB00_16475 [Microthrixaceae bacterium]|nr:hypothetical protein [Microthrixaceae bacterium]HND54522.1 hypothetical protein [Pirellulaceae bacterium]